MRMNRIGWLAAALVAIMFFSACPAQKEPEMSAQDVEAKIDGLLAKDQETIDKHWSNSVARRQECEASCKSPQKCPCLDGLKDDEQIIIMLMVSHANNWNVWKSESREFNLYYNWLPGFTRCHVDLKELFLALPESNYVDTEQLGLTLISHGKKEDNISFNIAEVIQELYAEKKITDIQAYLKKIRLLYARADEIDFGLKEKMELPYFILTQKSKTAENTQNILFSASVFDQELFQDYARKKFPWYGDSLDALIFDFSN